MTFPELLTEVQKLKWEEQRAHGAEYLEIVISKEGLAPLHKILSAYFGPPLKSQGRPSSAKAKRYAKSHGGIRKDQTMYFRQNGEHAEYALLWPWGSGARITIKVIQSKNSSSGGGWRGFLGNLFARK